MMRKKLIVLLIVFLGAIPALAGTTGKIAGIVRDADTGDILPGANIYVDGQPFGGSADADGVYFILNIPPGSYTVSAQMIGYQVKTVTDLRVSIDLTSQLNFTLSTESVEGAEVVIVADRALVQKDVTSSQVRVSADDIALLPVESFNDVLELQAGVLDGHFRGGRVGEVAYLVDGISITDPFYNELGASLENSFVQELEVISGTFNAEYGQAMSGIVNIVTKDGGSKLSGSLNAYTGSYLSANDHIFPNLDGSLGTTNFEGSLNGPVPGFANKLKFVANGRLFENKGHIYGRRVYQIEDNDPFEPSGDSSFVSMNDQTTLSFQGKLSYYPIPKIKLSYTVLWEDRESRGYNHAFRLVPDGVKTDYQTKIHQNLIVNHTLSNSTFHTLKLSSTESNYSGYVFEDPDDPNHVIPELGNPQSGYTFRSGGMENDRYDRTSIAQIAKWDVTSQVNTINKIGAGVEYRRHRLENFYTIFRAANQEATNINDIVYPRINTPGVDNYIREPFEISAYLQDKGEFEDLIINAGLRFDYFDPNTDMPGDLRNPLFIDQFPSSSRKAEVKTQLSPRLGVAYPISAQGVIHGSYGHFFQIPQFDLLYRGIFDEGGVTKTQVASSTGESGSLSTVVGNPDLKPQRTTSYELGLRQVLYKDLVLDVTAYFRDIRNLIGVEILETYNGNRYARFINQDYGNVRGFILTLEKRFSDYWGFNLDYTFQNAEGNASDPLSVFQDNQTDPPNEPEKKVIRLDWDQRSTLNIAFTVGKPGNWFGSLVGKIGSGGPYTADKFFSPVDITFRNDRNKPAVYTFDFRSEKVFKVAGANITGFLLVYNLFDRLNEYSVYGSSGRADLDYNTQFAGDVIGLHTIDEFVLNPAFYSAPREIRFGIRLGF